MNNLSSADISSALQSLESGYAPLPASDEEIIARALRELLALREAGKEPIAHIGKRMLEDLSDESRTCGRVWKGSLDELSGEGRIPLYAAPQLPAVPEYPELLPCPVLLEPGFRFGKGVPTSSMLGALKRRDERQAELDAMSPEAKAEYDASIEKLKTMLMPVFPAVPMQPLEIDAHGTLRFRQNEIVQALLINSTAYGYGLNEMALDDYSAEDRMQLAQLIGYSLSGYSELSYVSDESYDAAIAAAPKPEVK